MVFILMSCAIVNYLQSFTSKPRLVLSASMLFSPPKTFNLPSYAKGLAQVFSKVQSPIRHHSRPYNPNVVAFIDFEAQQVEDRLAPNEGSSSPSV